MTRDKAKAKVLAYYDKHGDRSHYPSDVASALGLNPKLVFELTEELVREGRLK